MGARHPNWRRVKRHHNYSVEDIARLFGLHKNTVRKYVGQGLAPIDDKRPALFLGGALADFLRARRARAKQPCRPGEVYCLACREPKAPAFGEVEYLPVTPATGNLRGICPDCAGLMHRRVNLQRLVLAKGNLTVTVRDAEPRIDDRSNPTVNCDFGRQAKP
jgi:hypothetical protein